MIRTMSFVIHSTTSDKPLLWSCRSWPNWVVLRWRSPSSGVRWRSWGTCSHVIWPWRWTVTESSSSSRPCARSTLTSAAAAPLRPWRLHRVKVTFKDEPGEGSGVARSFYTAIAQAFLSNDKLPNLDCVQSVSKGMQASSMCPFLFVLFLFCLFIFSPSCYFIGDFEVKQKLFLLFNFF